MKNQKKIGIMGGAGPEAGILLMQKIVQICQKKYACQADGDFPYILLLNYPFSDMLQVNSLSNQQEKIKEEIKECLRTFLDNNLHMGVIACNTAHQFLEAETIKECLMKGLNFFHMIEETKKFLVLKNIKNPLILCSNTSSSVRLHEQYFNCFYPEKNFQNQIQTLIDKILAGKQSELDVFELTHKINQYNSTHQSLKIGLLLGCTEFSVLHEAFPFEEHGLDQTFVVIDPTEVIATKICEAVFE